MVCAACGGDDDGNDTERLVDRFVDLEREQEMIECACPASGDSSCDSRRWNPTAVECFKMVAASHSAEVGPELQCLVEAIEAENACLRRTDCTDLESYEACLNVDDCDDTSTESYEEEVEDCRRSRAGANERDGGDVDGEAGSSGSAGARGDAGAGAGEGGSGGRGQPTAGAGGNPGGSGSGGNAGAAGSAGTAGSASEPSPGCGSDPPVERTQYTVDVDGTEREYVVSLPAAYEPDRPYRLIFGFHGLGGTALTLARTTYLGLQSHVGAEAILVAAQGLPADSSNPDSFGWPDTDGRDVAFVRAMLDDLLATYCVDEARIFAFGPTDGGAMSNRVGCEMGDTFRAIAIIAGSGPDPAGPACVGQVAAWMSHGESDMVVPFASGVESRDHWAMSNHCDVTTSAVSPDPCVAFDGCDEDHPVHFCGFDGGHVNPPWAAGAIWAFFSMF